MSSVWVTVSGFALLLAGMGFGLGFGLGFLRGFRRGRQTFPSWQRQVQVHEQHPERREYHGRRRRH